MADPIGPQNEWIHFASEHKALDEALKRAHGKCLNLLRTASAKSKSLEDKTILGIALACLREFEEIHLLCANGYGSGANKLLRAFFERVITLGFLAKHPKKVSQFIDYTNVHWHKLLIEARTKHDDVGLSDEQIAEIEDGYSRVKDNYMIEICRKCGTRHIQGSWTKKPVPDMAEDVDKHMRMLYFNAFLRPTFHLHSTYYGVMDGVEVKEAGKFSFFSERKERALAKETIDLAHILLLQMAVTVNLYYKLESDAVLEALGKELESVNK